MTNSHRLTDVASCLEPDDDDDDGDTELKESKYNRQTTNHKSVC